MVLAVSSAAVPSSNLFVPDGVPLRFVSHTETSTGTTLSVSPAGSTWGTVLVLGADVVAQGAEPVQCWVGLQIPSGVWVYWDSQSTGEGLGVRFPWRGQIPLNPQTGEQLAVYFSSAATIVWSITVWGLLLPFPGNYNHL